ncbi:MAG TPA: hypothetical protein P5218_03020, partial [Planctomycetota bacterium]|nr:hypothetical protein [Planctomycetota bacterium]
LDETGKVILDESRWEQAQTKIAGSKDRAKDAFDQALSREANRDRDLDALFQKAKDKVDRRGKGEAPEL